MAKRRSPRKEAARKEHNEAVLLMEWVRYAKAGMPELKRLFHIPNEGKRSLVAGAKLKAEGLRPGVSDYMLPVACSWGPDDRVDIYYGLWIELKAKGKYPTPNQNEFMNDMRDEGYAAYWCQGWEEMRDILIAYIAGRPIPGRDPKARGTYKLK